MLKLSTSQNDIQKAAAILQEGGLVAFPTETVYGLGANGLLKETAEKIYKAKGRPSDNPLILHVATKEEALELAEVVPSYAHILMDAFWPGPLTLVLKKKAHVPKESTGGLDTVAVRLPQDDLARKLIRAAGFPLAAPSANKSGRPSPTKAEHVEIDLADTIDALIDGGQTEFGLESTVVDATGDRPIILRPGAIGQEEIERLLNISLCEEKESQRPKAPGMKYRHYAPKAPVVLIEKEKLLTQAQKTPKAAILAHADLCAQAGTIPFYSLGQSDKEAAHFLFDGLRSLDALKPAVIYTHPWPEQGMGRALMNRLKKVSMASQDVYNIKEDL